MIFFAQPGQRVDEMISIAHPGQNKAMPGFSNTKNVGGEFLFFLQFW